MSKLVSPRCPRRAAVVVALIALASCSPSLELEKTAQLICDADSQCPADWHCAASIRRCVADDDPDHEGPALQRATAESATSLVLDFGEPLFADGAEVLGHYAIRATGEEAGAGLEVTAAQLRGPQTLVLTTSAQRPAQQYVVSAEGLFDLCGNPMTAAEVGFAGFGERPDSTPPELLSPAAGSALVGPELLFVWSARRGASGYTLEIALDEGMAAPLHQLSVAAPDTSAEVALPAGSYFWRVRSDLFGDASPSPVHVFLSSVHVYCAPGADCSDEAGLAAGDAGTPQRPFRRIARAMERAVQLGLSTVNVARRGEDDAYGEKVVLVDGLKLLGGWDAQFAERDPALRPTAIRTDSSPAVMVPYVSKPTGLSGLHIAVDSQEPYTRALLIANSTDAFVLEDCEVEVSGNYYPNQECAAVVLQNCGGEKVRGPTLKNNSFSVSCGTREAVALSILDSSPTVFRNQLVVADWEIMGHAFGLRSAGAGLPLVEENDVLAEGTVATGIVLSTPQSGIFGGSCDPEDPEDPEEPKVCAGIAGNRVIAIAGSSGAVGLELPGATYVPVERNRVVAQSNSAVALRVRSVYGVMVANNVLVAGTGEWDSSRLVGVEASDALDVTTEHRIELQLVHNTVLLGRVSGYDTDEAIAISLPDSAQPSVVNNLLFALPSIGRSYGIVEGGIRSDPVSVRNNAFVGLDVLYVDDVEGELTAAAALDRLDGQVVGDCPACPMDPHSRVGANAVLATTADQLFADFAGQDGSAEKLADADLHLAAGAPAGVLTGALDASGTDYCRPSSGGTCLPVTEDFDRNPRTPGPSIGAFERD